MSEMDQDVFSRRVLTALCIDGDIERVQTFLEKTLLSLPLERHRTVCILLTGDGICDDLPCAASIIHLSETAARGV